MSGGVTVKDVVYSLGLGAVLIGSGAAWTWLMFKMAGG